MANLVPYTKSPIIKPQKSAIVRADKFFNAKSSKTNVNFAKPKEFKDPSEDIILKIEKKVIKIDKLLKDSFALKKKQQKKSTIKDEQKEFEDREKELEKKKPKKEPGVNLPTPPKMGFIDWIKNFIFNTILGFLAVRLMKFLPTLLKIYPAIISVGEFLINVGGNILNSLVTFVDWGYKAVDATRGFIKNIGGEGFAQNFDKFVGAIDNVLEFAVMAAVLTAGGGDTSDSRDAPGRGGRPGRGGAGGRGVSTIGGINYRGTGDNTRGTGSTLQTQRLAKGKYTILEGGSYQRDIMKRYFQKYGRDAFVQRFGQEGLKELPGGLGRGALQKGARNAFVGLAGKGGAKTILKFVKPLVNKIPIVGGLIEFGLSWALGEPVGKAAFRGIGAVLVGAIGTAIGGPIGAFLGSWAGGEAGAVLYDMFFNNKKPKPKQGKTNKLAGGGSPIPPTRGGKSSSSTPKRTLKKKKLSRTLSFTPRKIKPGRSAGGEAKIQSVFPNPEKPAWWDLFGVFTGKKPEQQQSQQKKPKGKTPNSQEFLIKSNEVLGRAQNFGGFSTLIIKTLLGDTPDELDYLNSAKGLNSFMQEIYQPGTLGFSGGGKVGATSQGIDNTKIISKLIKESVSKEVDTTIRNLKNEMSLKSASKDSEDHDDMGGGGGGGGGEGGGYDDSPHGTPGPAVQATSGFDPGKGDKTRKIFLHWSAGSHNQNFNNYHTTFLGNGRAVRNRGYGVDGTEHTGGANTNSVGLAIAAMGGKGVNENKFGSFPPTSAQVSAMALEAARLAVAWGWDESTIDKNVSTHGEWERYATKSGILRGRPQRWDLDKLRQSDPMNSGGDKLRKMIKSYYKKLKAGATVDSSGKVISKTTGSPLAQMSLETAMEMTEPGSGSGARISGGTKDFWALAAISALEGINAQGEADVAQSIYNRAAAGIFPGGKSIHSIITKDPTQYSPVGESDPALWAAIKDKESAIKAVASHKNGKTNASKKVESAAKNIKNPALQAEASKFVGGRTDFNALSVYGSDPPGAISVVKRHGHRFGFWVGGGSKNYGRSNPKAAGVPSLGATVSSTGAGNVGSGNFRIVQYITGDVNYRGDGRQFYYDRPGHGLPSNYHDHIAFSTIAEKENAKRKLRAANINTGSEYRAGDPGYHGRNLAIDVPGGQWGGTIHDPIDSRHFAGSKRVRQVLGIGINAPRFHGGPILKTGYFWGHKGEYVIDADSVKLFGDIVPDINSIENKSQLIAKAPSIIEKLKQISGISEYAYYENPNQEPQIVYIEVPVEVPVPIGSGSGGGNIFISGGVNSTNDNIRQTLCQTA